jgi:hypothetical protein
MDDDEYYVEVGLLNATEKVEWCEQQQFRFRVYGNYDGGGYNYYVFIFYSPSQAEAFRSHYDLPDKPVTYFQCDGWHYCHDGTKGERKC